MGVMKHIIRIAILGLLVAIGAVYHTKYIAMPEHGIMVTIDCLYAESLYRETGDSTQYEPPPGYMNDYHITVRDEAGNSYLFVTNDQPLFDSLSCGDECIGIQPYPGAITSLFRR